MLQNAFIGRPEKPGDDDVTVALAVARPLWDQLLQRLAAECGLTSYEWGTSGRKYGWSLRVMAKKRRILYLLPSRGAFGVTLVLGDRAIGAARDMKLPAKVMRLIESGQRYPEGTAIRLEVASAKDIDAVLKLAAIKLQY